MSDNLQAGKPNPQKGWGDRIAAWIRARMNEFHGWLEEHAPLLLELPRFTLGDLYDWILDHFPVLKYVAGVRLMGFLIPHEEKEPSGFLTTLLSIPGLPPELRQSLERLRWYANKTEIPIDELVGLMGVNQALSGYLSPYNVSAAYQASRTIPTGRPEPPAAWAMQFRNMLAEPQLREYLKDQGWTDELIDAWREISKRWLSAGELIELRRRGRIGEKEFSDRLHQLGYDHRAVAGYVELLDRIPGPGDLISMAVREAFHPDLVAKYHYLDAFPGEFAEWMTKQGYSVEWAQRYWAAHWRLPSIGDAFTMLHRGVIGMDEIRDLLRTADIAPIWHEPLIKIAYAPYTRVDVRRMHALGVLSDEELVKAYMDLGYDADHAAHMAEFTILYNASTQREATKSDITKGYRAGRLERADAVQALIDIGYTPEWAEYHIATVEYEAAEEYVEEQIKTIQTLYESRRIDRAEAASRLTGLGLRGERINDRLELWTITRDRRDVAPSVSKLEEFYAHGIIDRDAFEHEMKSHGYDDTYITWYRENIDRAREEK